jgi:hypothetical protein
LLNEDFNASHIGASLLYFKVKRAHDGVVRFNSFFYGNQQERPLPLFFIYNLNMYIVQGRGPKKKQRGIIKGYSKKS